MTVLHDIDPIAIPLPFWPHGIHWYGLMYLLGFSAAWWLGHRRIRADRLPGVTTDAFGDLLFYGMLGVVLGGRIGYVLFYGFDQFIADPLFLLRINEGGMSFHGGLLGVLAAALWGKPTGGDWGVIFPRSDLGDYTGATLERLRGLHESGLLDRYARHPSQLYQAFLEGLVMFAVLYWYSRKPRPRYAVSGLFALLYGVFRFLVEFWRVPDENLGYLAFGWLTMGQLLSLPLIVLGVVLLLWSHRSPTLAPAA